MTKKQIEALEKEYTKKIGAAYQLAAKHMKDKTCKEFSLKRDKDEPERLAKSHFIQYKVEYFAYNDFRNLKQAIANAETFAENLSNCEDKQFDEIYIDASTSGTYDECYVDEQMVCVRYSQLVELTPELTKSILAQYIRTTLLEKIANDNDIPTTQLYRVQVGNEAIKLFLDEKIDFATLSNLALKK